jgi:GDP-L-fucose synthase
VNVSTRTLLITGSAGLLGAATLKSIREDRRFEDFNILTPTRSQLNLFSEGETHDFFEKNRPEVVIHLAAKVMGLAGNLNNQISALDENSRIDQNVLRACLKFHPRKIFYAGTAASYGYPYLSLPLSEDVFLAGEVHRGEFGYASAKRMALPYLKLLRDELGINTTYGIFTNLFGPNDRFIGEKTHVLPALIHRGYQASQRGEPLTVWGFPNTTRDFLYSEVAARYLLNLVNSDNAPLLVNICSGLETPMEFVVNQITSRFNLPNPVWQHDKPVGIDHRYLSAQILKDNNFYEQSNFSEDLEKTIYWYTQNIGQIR